MNYSAIEILRCPETGHPIDLEAVLVEKHGEIQEGVLVDREHDRVWPIHSFIPRFVESVAYAESFGEQWSRYRRTQIDRLNGTNLSRDRFYAGTRWNSKELKGQRILEAGCGAGRFTQVMLDAGAEVCAVDCTTAVNACWMNNGPHPSLCVVQADLYKTPFRRESFDRVFCYGVLQHMPVPKRAFMNLVSFVKPGGHLAVDVYARPTGFRDVNRLWAKYWWRPLTKRLPPRVLARIVEWYVPRWLPVDNLLQRVPKLGRFLTALVPCWNYSGVTTLTAEQVRQWSILDTFDALSAWYDFPQTISEVRSWFEEAGLKDIGVRPGGNGILGNARRA